MLLNCEKIIMINIPVQANSRIVETHKKANQPLHLGMVIVSGHITTGMRVAQGQLSL